MLKKFTTLLFLAVISCLIVSSLLPRDLAHKYFYQAVWFKGLWFIIIIGIITSIVRLFKKKDFKLSIVYIGFLVVLLGGLLTSLFEEEGFIEIKKGETVNGSWIQDELFRPLGFSLLLNDFCVEYYPDEKKGMRFVKSYKTSVSISKDGNVLKKGVIEVNRPLTFEGFNFYQYGYDANLPNQTVLQVVKDPGLGFVYGGYLILLSGLLFSFKRIWRI